MSTAFVCNLESDLDNIEKRLPPIPGHPEPWVMTWSDLEKRTIIEYGKACADTALAAAIASTITKATGEEA